MFSRLRGLLRPESVEEERVQVGYEPIGGGDESPSPSSISRRKEDDRTVYWCFWALGAGVLLSWNVLICTFPLFASYFPPDSKLRSQLASWLSTVFCFGNLLALGIAQRDVGRSSPMTRLRSTLLVLFLTMVLTTLPILPFLLPAIASTSQGITLAVLIALTAVLSFSTAYLQSAVFALAALWGSTETLGVMSGQGGIAVLVSGTQVVLAVVSVLHPDAAGDPGSSEGRPSSLAGVGLWGLSSGGALGCMVAQRYLARHPDLSAVLSSVGSRSTVATGKRRGGGMTSNIARKNARLNIAVAWVFVVTLAVFPPITTAILSVHQSASRLLQPAIFIPAHFLVFNIGDYVGRTYLLSIPSLLFTSQRAVLSLSFLRTLFIPLFLACNVASRITASPPLINSDMGYLVILLLFGVTNGYIGSLCMILASSTSLNPLIEEEEKDVAGTLAAFCLVAGLAGGSLLSFGMNYLVHGSVLG